MAIANGCTAAPNSADTALTTGCAVAAMVHKNGQDPPDHAAARRPLQQCSCPRGFPITLDQGPLICFSKAAEGEPQCVDLYVANCNGEQQGTRFWRNTGNTKVVAWLDQSHLLLASYGEPYALIVVDTLTGKITDDASYGPLALCHRVPPLPGAANAQILVFQIQTKGDEYLLMQKGKKDPIQAVPKDYRSGAKIQLAKDSTFAIVRLAHSPQLVQLYRSTKPPLALSSTGGADWQWLPAAVDVESSK